MSKHIFAYLQVIFEDLSYWVMLLTLESQEQGESLKTSAMIMRSVVLILRAAEDTKVFESVTTM